MNFSNLKLFTIPEGNVKSISIGGQVIWNALPTQKELTWDQVFASIDAGTYATDFAIGDTAPLDLGSEGIINMQIAAFDTDDLADGSGKAPITWIAKELLATQHRMNPELVTNSDGTYQESTGPISGWEKCEMRTYLKNTIKPMIPEIVRNSIKIVTKTQDAEDTNGTKFTQTTVDDIWIPSYNETIYYARPYIALFPDNDSRKKILISDPRPYYWWLRDTHYDYHTRFKIINSTGTNDKSSAHDKNGVCLCFCT